MSRFHKFSIHNRASPGDVFALTGVVRDLALADPGRFAVTVDSFFPDLWRHNAHAAHGPMNGRQGRVIEAATRRR